MKLCWAFFLSMSLTLNLLAQELVLQKEPIRSSLEECFFHIYNSDTVAFQESASSLAREIPGHPINDLLGGLSIYWAKYPLDLNGEDLKVMKEVLGKTIDQCDEILDEDEDNFEIKYIKMIGHAMLALSYNRDGQFFRAAAESKKAYNYFRDGFKLMNDYPEFYFSSGLYSYYREKYPEIYPIYRTIIWVFKSGDKAEGIRLMKKAVEETVFARAEAAHYVGHVMMRYEKDPEDAIKYSGLLRKDYPKNLFFRANYIENLLFLGRYEEAAQDLDSFPDSDHAYYQMAKSVFQAIISENKFEYELAETLYNQSLEISERGVSEEIDNLKSLAHSGLARLSLLLGDEEKARVYYRKALKDVKFELYQQEPEEYIELHPR